MSDTEEKKEEKKEIPAQREAEKLVEDKKRYAKTRVGMVVSDKMTKTVVVEVMRLMQHPRFKKYIKRHKKYKAHDEKGVAKVGDKVMIRETKPLSKTKRWTVAEVLK